MLGNRLAHRFAHLGIFRGEPQRAFGNAHAARGDVDPAQFKPAGRLEKALPLHAADQVLGRQAIVFQHQFGAVDRLVAQLVELLAHRKPRPLGRDEKAHALVARIGIGIGLGQKGKAAALDRIGYPGLGAVQHITIAAAPRDGADRLQVGAGIGFGQGKPAANLARGKAGQPGTFLRVGAEPFDRTGHDEVRIEDARQCHPVRRDQHDDLGIGLRGQAKAAMILADGRAEQAHLGHLRHQRLGPDIAVIVVHHHRADIPVHPLLHHVEQRGLVVRMHCRPGGGAGGSSGRWGCHRGFLNLPSGRSPFSRSASRE